MHNRIARRVVAPIPAARTMAYHHPSGNTAMTIDQIIDLPFTTDAMKAAVERRIIQAPELSDQENMT